MTPTADIKTLETARKAVQLMETHGVSPNPENYTVWYHYTLAENQELVREINQMLKNKVPFNANTANFLNQRFIANDRREKAIQHSAAGAGKLLGEVLKAVQDFSGETKSYNQDIDGYMQKITVDIDDQDIKGLVKELITATADIRERGQAMTQKLDESRMEVENLKRSLDQITTESQRDFLTGVYNRKAFDQAMEVAITEANATNGELSLLMVDIDHFKQFNDKFGHLLGDEVLKIVAKSMTDSVRGKDAVARYGGEEFAVILPATPVVGAFKVAETIRATIAGKELKRKDTGVSYGNLTVSIGIAHWRCGQDTIAAFIERADAALYESKRGGRNRVTVERN